VGIVVDVGIVAVEGKEDRQLHFDLEVAAQFVGSDMHRLVVVVVVVVVAVVVVAVVVVVVGVVVVQDCRTGPVIAKV
jgi:hypothetical protein